VFCWDQIPKIETKWLNFGLSPVLSLTNHRRSSALTAAGHDVIGHSSLILPYFLAKSEVILAHQNLISYLINPGIAQ